MNQRPAASPPPSLGPAPQRPAAPMSRPAPGPGAYPPQARPQGPNPQGREQPAQQPRKGRGLKTLFLLMALLVTVGIILQSTLFRVRSIQVYGNVNLSDEEVILQSGLASGQNIFAVNKEQVAQRIDQNRYLKFQSLRRDYPDTVTLVVYERLPCATLQSLGIQYTLDKTGRVLEETEHMTPMEGLVVVTGMRVEQAVVGREITSHTPEQLAVLKEVLYELDTKGMQQEISELNVSDLDNLYLVSVDGFSIRLGDSAQIGPKLISFQAVHEELLRMEKSGGTIDVSAPVYPTYIP